MNKYIMRVKSTKYIEYIFLAIILILGLYVRLYKINNPLADWHSWRQADTASVSRTFQESGINLLYPRYHDVSTIQTGIFNPEGYRFVEFPIYNAVHVLAAGVFSNIGFEVWGRLISIFSALVSTILMFFIGKKFLDSWGGLLTAFFFAFLPFNIYFTRVILPDPLAVTFGLASIWLFIKFIESKENNIYLILAGGAMAVALLIKPFVIFYSIPIAYLAVQKFSFKNIIRNKTFILTIIISVAPFIFWRYWMEQFPEGIPFYKWAFNGDGIRFKPSFWKWIFGERLGRLILGGWGLIPFSVGLLKKQKKIYFNHFFLLGMFLYVVVFATANVRHDYYQILIIPAVSVALAVGAQHMWRAKEFNKILSRVILVFSIFLMFLTSGFQVREFYKIIRPEIVVAGEAIQRITPEDALVIAPYNGDTAFLYQTKRWGWPYVDREITELIEKGAEYFVSVNLNDTETIEVAKLYTVLEKTDSYIIVDLTKPLEL